MKQLKTLGDNTPSKRAGHNMVKIDAGKYLVLGGVSQMKELDDFWMLHLPLSKDVPLVGVWQKLDIANNGLYTPRSSQIACYGDGLVYIFGGQKFHEGQSTDEFFVLDIQSKTLKIQASKNKPKGRNSHTMNYFNGKIYLFGGANQNGPLADLCIFDVISQQWENINLIDQMIGREMHTAQIIKTKFEFKVMVPTQGQKVVELFGEQDDEQVINSKVQDLQVNTVNQEQIEPQQLEQNVQQERDYLIIFGGRNGEQIFNEIVAIDLISKEATVVSQLPFPLCAHSSVQVNSRVLIFGGFNSVSLNKEILSYNNQTVMKAGDYPEPVMASAVVFAEETQNNHDINQTVNKIETIDLKIDSMVHDGAFDYYGSKIAVGTSDGKIYIKHTNKSENQHIAILVAHAAPVWQLAWSHPKFGNILASCSFDKSIKLWREDGANRFEEIHKLDHHIGSINTIAWLADEYILAAGQSDGAIFVYKYSNEQWQHWTQKMHSLSTNSVSWLNQTDKKILASGSNDQEVHIWEFESGLKIREQIKFDSWVRGVNWAIDLCDDQPLLAVSTESHGCFVIFLDPITYKSISKFEVSQDLKNHPCWKVSWSPLGNQLAVSTLNNDGECHIRVFTFNDEDHTFAEI